MSDEDYKIVGELDSDSGAAVYGHNAATSGNAIGVEGSTASDEGYGLYTDEDAHVGGTVQASGVQSSNLNDVHWVDPAEGYEGLQGTLDALGTDPGTVVVGPGTIDAPDNVLVPSNTTLAGTGMFGGSTIRLADEASLSLAGTVRIEGHNVAVRDLEIDGNSANNEFTDSQEHALYTSGATDVRLSRIWAHDAPGYGIDPHDEADEEPTERIVVEDCLSENHGVHGIAFAGIQHGVISNCVSVGNDDHGIDLTDALGHDISVLGCHSIANGRHGLVVHNGTETVRAVGCSFSDNGRVGVKFGSAGDTESWLSVTGCTVEDNGSYGLQIRPTDYALVANNVISGNAASTGNAEVSIQTDSTRGSGYSLVTGNQIRATGTFGVDERDGAGPSLLTSNVVTGTYSTAIDDAHPDTVVANNLTV